eukprot:CAMPEP_0113330210 /NCGR_PEP_ID=MMETSP0010_2-20120614/21457_1 /TAXON_ID=216773 ORGANISM="Corethron hystrix, Strain 308" /NCGR_SAMPLE_ID=MMETSP0010_2 /ASSEMBLY_ACC=CAM_ASM_000155 /LENGTH=277 /DNA_ID=CAMNT_0000192641 /DNA_START=189 /DNA_END=1022 /DNA_ORIENTATION=- /assembly_acc=CAM_ASM_000155
MTVPKEVDEYLTMFRDALAPYWFRCIFELCNEEASVSIAYRLLVLLLQSSPEYYAAFNKSAGGFNSLISSIPKFSSSASIILPMLSMFVGISIRRLPLLPSLEKVQLNELFDGKTFDSALLNSDSGIFALLCECISRNFELSKAGGEEKFRAKNANDAIITLLLHLHQSSVIFKQYCRTKQFLGPLIRALFYLNDTLEDDDCQEINTSEGRVIQFLGPTYSNSISILHILSSILSHDIIHNDSIAILMDEMIHQIPLRYKFKRVQAYQMILIDIIQK